ncbi:MAG TPA: prepilin-type N-terminal cleavage/methylation domain-containing protein [Candidatus Saccharimonadales bacterium]|jgi:prepilin-type N-terminal cleavage/methylation domain-containing protein|nr:prepilin-type N-terminal cleavage/methylation domain-containing protein [Candidatus Saccharimonadales bacterium]
MLSELKKSNSDQQHILGDAKGFTIIEVMIVLAIAGLILLIVFLAVPALQRSSRNTNRKSDAGRLASSISNFVSNNNGTAPSTAPNLTTVVQDAGTLGIYTGLTTGTGVMAQGHFNVMAEPAAGLAAPTIAVTGTAPTDALELLTGAQCTTGGASQPGSSTRSLSMLYTIEPGAGANYEIVCQDI